MLRTKIRRGEVRYHTFAYFNNVERHITYLPIINSNINMSDLNITLSSEDTLCVLTVNRDLHRKQASMPSLIGKMSVLNQEIDINLMKLSNTLTIININKMLIISINLLEFDQETFYVTENMIFMEIGAQKFISLLNDSDNFLS